MVRLHHSLTNPHQKPKVLERSWDKDDFAELLLTFQDAVSVGGFSQGQNVADNRINPLFPGQLQDKLLLVAGGPASSQHIEMPAVEQFHVDGGESATVLSRRYQGAIHPQAAHSQGR